MRETIPVKVFIAHQARRRPSRSTLKTQKEDVVVDKTENFHGVDRWSRDISPK